MQYGFEPVSRWHDYKHTRISSLIFNGEGDKMTIYNPLGTVEKLLTVHSPNIKQRADFKLKAEAGPLMLAAIKDWESATGMLVDKIFDLPHAQYRKYDKQIITRITRDLDGFIERKKCEEDMYRAWKLAERVWRRQVMAYQAWEHYVRAQWLLYLQAYGQSIDMFQGIVWVYQDPWHSS